MLQALVDTLPLLGKNEMNFLLSSNHYENISMLYTAIFHGCKNGNLQMKKCDIFPIFAQNIDRGYSLKTEAVLTSTHDLCFRAKIRK